MVIANEKRRGVALVLAVLLCLVLVPIVGLAIDGSIAYMMRAKLSTAIDAAVLAGARSLNRGADIDSQRESAKAVARRYFTANLPAGDWGAMINQQDPIATENNTTHIRSVSLTASADVPLTFLGILNLPPVHISLTGTAQRRDVNVVLVLDHSGSMLNAMPAMRTAAVDFVNMFAGGRDNLGLVVFAGATFVAFPPASTFKTGSSNVVTLINQLESNNGATSTAQAIWQAWGQLQNLNQPGALNVIVLFTDGLANTFAASFSPPLLTAASGCADLTTPKVGVILADINGTNVGGLSDPIANSLNDTAESRPAPNSAGCIWNTDITNTRWSLASALTGLPAVDSSGNSTNGSPANAAYAPVNLHQVSGINVTNAGLNALDDAANRIRSDTTLRPLIYAVGLGGNPGYPPDQVLMARIANDPVSASFHASQAPGLFVYSPTTAQLHAAFMRIASEILRLSM